MDQSETQETKSYSFMERWDAVDEEAAGLKKEADQKLFSLITSLHEWVTKQNLPWMVAGSDGKFAATSPANIYINLEQQVLMERREYLSLKITRLILAMDSLIRRRSYGKTICL